MIFRQRAAANASLSYCFGCIGMGRAVVVDVAREAFVEALVADIPPQPREMARIVAANLRGIAPEVAPA